jgi:hypothetical protein
VIGVPDIDILAPEHGRGGARGAELDHGEAEMLETWITSEDTHQH